jgi:hypothetical protein
MRDPRILMLSERNAESRKWHAFQYEFEDVICAVDSVDLLAPPARRDTPATRLADRVVRRAGHPERVTKPAIQPVTVTAEYDLFFAVFSFETDIPHLLQLKHWRERCDKAICFIVELFTDHLERAQPYLKLLKQFEFDQVFLLNPRPKVAVAEASGAKADFLGLGVDAFRFSPYPDPPARSIDFYQFGRRSPVAHAAALEMARTDGVFYVYDTVFNVPLPDYRAHREMMAEYLKRSRYFFSYRPGQDLSRGREDDALSSRYFEATAGGAVLLGNSPSTQQYQECFGWPDSTIHIPYEAHDLREIVADLDAQPERLAQARTNNIVGGLRQHDWVYRWSRVLDAAGLRHTDRMAVRRQQLDELAAMVETTEPRTVAST